VVWISRPDNAIRQVWVSPTRFRFSFADPSLRPRFRAILERQGELFEAFPDRAGNETLALWLNRLSRWYPRPILFLVLGAVGLAYRRPRGSGILLALVLSALLVVVFNALGLFADRHFILPVAPAFVLLACAAWLGPRRPDVLVSRAE
jgi:O-antigen ligase